MVFVCLNAVPLHIFFLGAYKLRGNLESTHISRQLTVPLVFSFFFSVWCLAWLTETVSTVKPCSFAYRPFQSIYNECSLPASYASLVPQSGQLRLIISLASSSPNGGSTCLLASGDRSDEMESGGDMHLCSPSEKEALVSAYLTYSRSVSVLLVVTVPCKESAGRSWVVYKRVLWRLLSVSSKLGTARVWATEKGVYPYFWAVSRRTWLLVLLLQVHCGTWRRVRGSPHLCLVPLAVPTVQPAYVCSSQLHKSPCCRGWATNCPVFFFCPRRDP